MCVFYLMFVNIYYWEKLAFSTCLKSKFLGKKIWRNALDLKSKKVQSIFGKTFFLELLYSAVFLRKWGWLQGHNEGFPKHLG